MRAGDIVFFKPLGGLQYWWDYLIGIVSPNYAHTGFAINSAEFIHADIRGVIKSNISDYDNFNIVRLNKAYNVYKAVEYAKSFLNDRYDVLNAIIAGSLYFLSLRLGTRVVRLAEKIDNNWICSELTAQIVRDGLGINVLPEIPNVADILPDDLYNYVLGIGEKIDERS